MIIKIIVTGFLFGFGIKFGYWAFCTLHDIIYGIVMGIIKSVSKRIGKNKSKNPRTMNDKSNKAYRGTSMGFTSRIDS